MSLSRRARKQLIAFGVTIALLLIIGVGGNQLRLARKASSASEGLKLGTAAFEAGDYEEAMKQLNRYVPRNQDDSDAVYMLAKSRLEVPQDGGGHFASARAFAQRAIDNDPDSVRNRLLLVEVLQRGGGTLDERLRAIDEVLSLDPSRIDLRLTQANLLYATERVDDALATFRAIAQNNPDNLQALFGITRILETRPAEYNQWIAELDQRATAEQTPPTARVALDIARINARLNLSPNTAEPARVTAMAVTRALGSFDILTESLLPSTVRNPETARAVLGMVDRVERALRITRPREAEQSQPTLDRLNAVNDAAVAFVERHTMDPLTASGASAELVAACMEWLWTSDRLEQLQSVATRWRDAAPAGELSAQSPPAVVAIEALISMTRVLPEDQLSSNIAALAADSDQPLVRIWSNTAGAVAALRARDLPLAESLLQQAAADSEQIALSNSFSGDGSGSADAAGTRRVFLAALAQPAINLLAADAASRGGDTARAINLWTIAARERPVWDQPALQLLETYRSRGSIGQAEALSSEAMLRGATLGAGLTVIDARVDQYELGLIPYEAAQTALDELEQAGFPEPPIRVARLRLAVLASLREPDRTDEFAEQVAATLAQTAAEAAATETDSEAAENQTAAETLVRMLRVTDELGVFSNPAFVPAETAEAAAQAINARFAELTTESKFVASLLEVARTGVYGPALERLIAEVERVRAADGSDADNFDHQRILASFTAELARSYQAVEQQAYDRLLAFAQDNPANADAQLLFIDSLLRAGEIPPVRTEALTEALDRLRDTLGRDSYAYNFAESRRLYASPATRTPEVARQEIITRLDPFVEGPQAGSAPVEVLHLVSKWWELLPNSLERRLEYLRRAQRTGPTAWGIYPDLIVALNESGEIDEAASAVAAWGSQLRPSLGLRSQRRDLAQFVGSQYNAIAQRATDDRSLQMQSLLWSMAINDAANLARTTGDRLDRLRYAEVLLAAPDRGVARTAALSILRLDEAAAQRVDASRPDSFGPSMGVADLTVAAAFETAVGAITLDSPDQQDIRPITEDDLPVIAAAAQLIAENAPVRRLTTAVASGERTNFPATVRLDPEPQVARTIIDIALGTIDEDLHRRAIAMFYAVAYQPERWQGFADEARTAMLAIASREDLTEFETRSLVYPLSQLGEVETAVALQRSLTLDDEAPSESIRINDIVAIAELLREAGQTEQAFAALDALTESDRSSLATDAAPIGAQALVALLELETRQQQTPVTSAFVRRVTANPQAGMGPLQLAIESAADSTSRRRLLDLVSDGLIEAGSDSANQDMRPAVASLWFVAATLAAEDDPIRRDLFTQAIARLNDVAQMDEPGAKAFAYRRKAYCEIELGQVDLGIRTYRMALVEEPNDPATLNNLADALKRQNQHAEAVQTAERAIAAARAARIPETILSIFYDTLGGSNLALGNVDQALVALQTSLDLDPGNNAARVTLAEAQLAAERDADLVRATIEPIGPAAEQDMPASVRERLQVVRDRL